MNILITGSSGFIGHNLVKKLRSDHEIFTIDKRETRGELSDQHFVCDLSDYSCLSRIDDPIDVVYHFGSASSILSYRGNEAQLADLEIHQFVNILRFSKKKRVKKFIYPSTASLYSSNSQGKGNVLNPLNIYAAVKFTEEQIARHYNGNTKTLGLRIFMAYGPGEESKGARASPISLFLYNILKGESPLIFGDGSQTRDPIFIDDLVDILTSVLYKPGITGVRDVCTGDLISFNDIISIINRVATTNITPKYVPRPKSYIEGATGDSSFAKEMLGRDFTSIDDGIKSMIYVFKNKSNKWGISGEEE